MDETRANDGLKYIGDGASIIGVPARDLTGAEVGQYGKRYLLSTGLYREYEIKKAYVPKPTKSALKGHGIEAEKE